MSLQSRVKTQESKEESEREREREGVMRHAVMAAIFVQPEQVHAV